MKSRRRVNSDVVRLSQLRNICHSCSVKISEATHMRLARRAFILSVIVLVAAGAFILFSRFWRRSSTTNNRVPPVDVTGRVTVRFDGCAGRRAVFLFETGMDYPIFARVHPTDWPDFKEANLQYGLHKVYYKASGAMDFKYVGPMFDAVDYFRPIMPRENVRYGVDLWKGPGQYTVTVPYMEDAEVARGLNENWVAMVKEQLPRVNASWKEVSSGIVTNTCQ